MTALWWQTGVIYQIYPRSFQDTNGDGIGDLKGIEQRLDYLASLGVDAIWISPIYPSPMADFGYDVADYCDVDARFGTLADFDDLLAQAHARGLKVLLDFVPNHTSDRHPWFVESRSSRDNPKRDWYIWRDPAPDGGPPNNWISDFGGSAWEWDEATGQYYYHAFLKEQADLNWRNPAVQAAMYDVMRFWFDRGVDGFRIDVLWHMVKAADFPDNPPNPRLSASDGRHAPRAPAPFDRPARGARDRRRHARHRRQLWRQGTGRTRADRRDLPAGRSADALLRPGTGRVCTCPSTSSSSMRRGRRAPSPS